MNFFFYESKFMIKSKQKKILFGQGGWGGGGERGDQSK